MTGSRLSRVRALARTEWTHLTQINASDRPWQMPLAAALASGLPLMVGAWFGHMGYGLISSLGGLAFLYLPDTPLSHRMITLMACANGMSACYALGVISHFFPLLMTPAFTYMAILVTMVCRFYRLPPPGSVFFIMAASIGMYTPGVVDEVPLKVGLFVMGGLLACLVAFFFSFTRCGSRRRSSRSRRQSRLSISSCSISSLSAHSSAFRWRSRRRCSSSGPIGFPISSSPWSRASSLRAVWNRQVPARLQAGIGLLLTWGLLMACRLAEMGSPPS